MAASVCLRGLPPGHTAASILVQRTLHTFTSKHSSGQSPPRSPLGHTAASTLVKHTCKSYLPGKLTGSLAYTLIWPPCQFSRLAKPVHNPEAKKTTILKKENSWLQLQLLRKPATRVTEHKYQTQEKSASDLVLERFE